MKIALATFLQKRALINQLDLNFSEWRPHFEAIAQYLLPRKYQWLSSTAGTFDSGSGMPVNQNASALKNQQNSRILDPAGTIAARTLANGLMNGITSPARPWFSLRLTQFSNDPEGYPKEYKVWLEEVTRRMLIILAESNFYTAMGMMYLELAGFGTSAMLIYEDRDETIRCYNSPMGEYRLIQDNRRMVVGYSRTFHFTVAQAVKEYGLDNCSPQTQMAYKRGGASLLQTVLICHLIEENNKDDSAAIKGPFKYREFYWEKVGHTDGTMLRIKGYREKPLVAPRWELQANDTYGTSPTMDALPEIKQLQLETKQKGQSIDKMIRPPIVADIMLQNQPTALLPGGVSYVQGVNSFGAKPIYTVNPPLDAMTADIRELHTRIKIIYFNNLFRNVSDLETVRSAAEIYERKAEDMLLLGPVLERFENEALDPALIRVFNIAKRQELLPPPPPGLDDATLDIRYVSVLADAQRAAATGSIERFMQVVGQLAAAVPEVLKIPDYDALVREYAERLNVPATALKSRAQVLEERAAEQEQLDLQNAALVGNDLTNAAKNLSQTDVGGGQNAIQALMGA